MSTQLEVDMGTKPVTFDYKPVSLARSCCPNIHIKQRSVNLNHLIHSCLYTGPAPNQKNHQTLCLFYLLRYFHHRGSTLCLLPTHVPCDHQMKGWWLKVHRVALWEIGTIDLITHPITQIIYRWEIWDLILAVIITHTLSYLVKPDLHALRLTLNRTEIIN